MSVHLIRDLPLNYCRAESKREFFDGAERDKIEKNEKREQPPLNVPGESCTTNLFMGFFFDGTRNNYVLADKTKSHSNVVRLYDCFPGLSVDGVLPKKTDWKYRPERYTHFFRVYVPGVASPFKEVGEIVPDKMGGAMGAGGDVRITWALVQAINNVNRYFLQQPLVSPAETLAIVKRISLSRMARHRMHLNTSHSREQLNLSFEGPRIEFEKLLRRLHANVAQHWKTNGGKPAKIDPAIVETIHISTFGFSRGATQARAFANWLESLCKLDGILRGTGQLSLGGFPVVFDFLGLFDSVSSIGPGNTYGDSPFLPRTNGHFAWADAEDSLRISSSHNRCVHLVAAHELRSSFPLDSIAVGETLPTRAEEIVFPGVHSDVGGAYSPKEHGKGLDENGVDMLSRLPLLYMYKEARLAGVPLKLELADDVVKERFRTTEKTIQDVNAFLTLCEVQTGTITAIFREQAIMQMKWRYTRRKNGPTPLHEAPNFLRAETFDQNDLASANDDFERERRDFEQSIARRGDQKPRDQPAGFDTNYDKEWEQIAIKWPFDGLAPAVLQVFDEYVHDSRAGFKLLGEDNEADAILKVRTWSRQLAAAKQHYSSATEGSAAHGPPDYGMSTNEREAAEAYDRTGKLPRYYAVGREPYSAGSGYLRFRKIYGGSDTVLLSGTHPPHSDQRKRHDDVAASNEPVGASTKTG